MSASECNVDCEGSATQSCGGMFRLWTLECVRPVDITLEISRCDSLPATIVLLG